MKRSKEKETRLSESKFQSFGTQHYLTIPSPDSGSLYFVMLFNNS